MTALLALAALLGPSLPESFGHPRTSGLKGPYELVVARDIRSDGVAFQVDVEKSHAQSTLDAEFPPSILKPDTKGISSFIHQAIDTIR
jgi:hypothetical protein